MGVSKETFRGLFGEAEPSGIDDTALDRLMPHPVYARMYWVSVINPSAATFETVKPLLAEARKLLASRDGR
ncbi:hypothetical protein FQZ97_1136310 [compost metagenome]